MTLQSASLRCNEILFPDWVNLTPNVLHPTVGDFDFFIIEHTFLIFLEKFVENFDVTKNLVFPNKTKTLISLNNFLAISENIFQIGTIIQAAKN